MDLDQLNRPRYHPGGGNLKDTHVPPVSGTIYTYFHSRACGLVCASQIVA